VGVNINRLKKREKVVVACLFPAAEMSLSAKHFPAGSIKSLSCFLRVPWAVIGQTVSGQIPSIRGRSQVVLHGCAAFPLQMPEPFKPFALWW
jgi:hypothetical protein